MSFFSALGGIVGGIAGFAVGGPTGVALGAGMGFQVGGGVDSYNQMQANASYASTYASMNAAYAQQMAEYNADTVLQSSAWNAMLTFMSGVISAQNAIKIAAYNARIKEMIGAYNAKLLREQAALVYKKLKLDKYQFDRQVRKLIGSQRVAYAFSGAMIDAPGNTSEQVEIDTRTEAELEKAVMTYNADIEAKKLLDAAALSEWQGKAEAAAVIAQGNYFASNLATRALFGAFGDLVQGKMKANMIRYGGGVRSAEILSEGAWRSSQYDTMSWKLLTDGLFKAADIGTRAYMYYNMLNTSTPGSSPLDKYMPG